jgi:hypothetical protein
LAVALGALVLASCGSSEQPHQRKWNPNAGPGRSEDWHSPIGMLLKYGLNKDGSLTRKNLEAGLRADFNKADTEHTGCLNTAEVTTINEERMSYDESAASPLIDFKNKGCIDFDEYAQMPRSLFDELDTDGNGVLTPKELHGAGNKRHAPTGAAAPSFPEPGGGAGDPGGGRGGGGGY